MSTGHTHENMLPRGAVAITGALVVFALVATTLVRVTGTPPAASPAAFRTEAGIAAVSSRNLTFSDRADGAVVIVDADTRAIVSIIAAGEETGFIRGVMRGFARDRRTRGLGAAAPFALTLWQDGQLSLADSATGRQAELTAFGATNRAAFAALLPGARR